MKKYCCDCFNWTAETTRSIRFGKCCKDNKWKNSHFECDLGKFKKIKGDVNEKGSGNSKNS